MTTRNDFIDKISNEQTALLPAIEFRGEIRVVEQERDIAAACKYLAAQPVLGFDTETRPSFRQGVTFRVSLLQLSSPEVCYLFRLNRIPFDRAILRLLEEKSLLKLSAIVLGQRVSKAQRLSNWEAATLTDKQRLYAATDAWVCTRIYERLLRTPKKTIRK